MAGLAEKLKGGDGGDRAGPRIVGVDLDGLRAGQLVEHAVGVASNPIARAATAQGNSESGPSNESNELLQIFELMMVEQVKCAHVYDWCWPSIASSVTKFVLACTCRNFAGDTLPELRA